MERDLKRVLGGGMGCIGSKSTSEVGLRTTWQGAGAVRGLEFCSRNEKDWRMVVLIRVWPR